jgi:methionyl-tRNA formyltransferase
VSIDKKTYNEPGVVTHCDENGMLVSTGEGNLLIKTVQLEGKKTIGAGDFGKGFSVLNKTLS